MSVRKNLIALGFSGAIGFAGGIAAPQEGKVNTTYLDVVGIPTICYGHTGPDVRLGQTLSDEECLRLLGQDLGYALRVVNKAVTVPMTQEREGALGSFVMNVGAGAFRDSTLLRKLNAGDTRGACDEMRRWIYADGKEWDGLVHRREVERKYCLVGVE